MFNFVPVKQIVTFEVREAPDVGARLGFAASGNLLVRTILGAMEGRTGWVARPGDESLRLREFLSVVVQAHIAHGS